MRVSIRPEPTNTQVQFTEGAPSASSWDSSRLTQGPRPTLHRGIGAGAAVIAFVLGGTTSATTFAQHLNPTPIYYTAYVQEERRRWTWRGLRLLALAILHKAEARREEIAEAEARFYADPEESAE